MTWMSSVARDPIPPQILSYLFGRFEMLLVTKLTLNMHVSRLNDNHQNHRTKFVVLSEPQNSEVFDRSMAS